MTTALVTTATGLAVPSGADESIPEWRIVAAAFLGSYRNPKTRQNYANGLKAWFAWCRQHGLDPLRSVKRPHIEMWMRQMEEVDGLAMRTICGRLNAISGYYRTAVMDGYIEGSPVTYVKRPRIERVSSTNYLTRVELGRVLEEAEKKRPRDVAILCLLGLNGLRCSEVVGIDIEDMGRERGYKTILVHRKGDKTQTIPLSPRTQWAIEQTVGDRTSGPLFTSLRTPGKRITPRDIQGMVKRYAKLAKVPPTKRISPHSFRHSFVTLSLDAGVSTRDVMNSAGHSDPRMTSYYDRNRESLAHNATHQLTAFVEGAI